MVYKGKVTVFGNPAGNTSGKVRRVSEAFPPLFEARPKGEANRFRINEFSQNFTAFYLYTVLINAQFFCVYEEIFIKVYRKFYLLSTRRGEGCGNFSKELPKLPGRRIDVYLFIDNFVNRGEFNIYSAIQKAQIIFHKLCQLTLSIINVNFSD